MQLRFKHALRQLEDGLEAAENGLLQPVYATMRC